MTSDEVLEEFLLDPCCIDCPASDCINERRMAEEIVRLRQEVGRMQLTVAALREPVSVALEAIAERKKVERIMDALREPSEAVVKAAASTYFTTEALQRAVAAAEREVGNDA